ncbi:polysaccharide deacetylase family protein [Sphingomonas montana]|uniref:polysaccharide deacetylase family protein n=1 Tax=Sphingomonas montana TaxID=1843236 RepID=UPI00101AE925|nr:polysaccharide deacetylase family protein [Sphingomonas montana]
MDTGTDIDRYQSASRHDSDHDALVASADADRAAVIPARLDYPPAPTARAAFAPDFGRRFAIFGDAEEEFDWTRPVRREAQATTAMLALPAANRRFVDRGIVPTYLVDYPVVDTPASADAVRTMIDAGECEVGTQLHPWVNPPHDEPVSQPNSFVGNLPRALERAKLHALTDRIQAATGIRPVIYRAGRYGIGPNTAELLAEAGYRLDVSVRALFDYSEQSGPDFRGHPVWPWWITPTLLEVPLTAGYTGVLHRHRALHRHVALRGPLARLGLLSRVALTPEGMPLAEALAVIDRLLDEGVTLFSLSFHTPSVVPGHTPYVRDQADLTAFWTWWDRVFDRFAARGVLPARASEILAAAVTH